MTTTVGTSIAANCTADLIKKMLGYKDLSTGKDIPGVIVNGGPAFGDGKIFEVRDEESFAERIKIGITPPVLGIWYGGMVGKHIAGSSTQPSAELTFVLCLFLQGTNPGGAWSQIGRAQDYLDGMRKVLFATRAPTGHYWTFQSEMPLGKFKDNYIVYLQKWKSAIQISGR